MANILSTLTYKALKDYISLKVQMFIDRAIDLSSSMIASFIGIIFFTFSFLLFFFFSTYALVLFLNEYFEKDYWGYLIISGFYLLSGILFWFCRNTFVKKPVSKLMYKTLEESREE